MNTDLHQGSAKIYQFPAGGRAALGGRRYGETKAALGEAPVTETVCSGSWYHDEAIQQANPNFKPTREH